MNIEYVVVRDPNDLQVLLEKSSQYKNLHFQFNQQLIDALSENLKNNDSLYLMGKIGGKCVAFCAMDTNWIEKEAFFIREIFIEPKYQKQGLGRELLNKCIDYAKKKNGKCIITQTDTDNLPMQKLCKSTGFVEWLNPEWKDGKTYRLTLR